MEKDACCGRNWARGGLLRSRSGEVARRQKQVPPALSGRSEMPSWRTSVASKFAQYYNVSIANPPADVNVPVSTASEHLARAVKILKASEVNESYMKETGFRFPTLVPQGLVKLGASTESFTPAFVAQHIGMLSKEGRTGHFASELTIQP